MLHVPVGACGVQILQQLDAAKKVPDFTNYLSFIFAKADTLPLEVRCAEGWTSRRRALAVGWSGVGGWSQQRGTALLCPAGLGSPRP